MKRIRETWINVSYGWFNQVPRAVAHARGTRILIYHGVCKSEALKFNARFLTEAQFESHLVALKKCFNIISFEDFSSGNLSSDKLNVFLTFDDGLKNNFESALPLLLKHQVPATFFITVVENNSEFLFNDLLDVFSLMGPASITINSIAFVKQKSYIHYRYVNAEGAFLANYFHATNANQKKEIIKQIFNYVPLEKFEAYKEYLALMSDEEIKLLSFAPGITLGTHGVSHSDFGVLAPNELSLELKESRDRLEKLSGKECRLVAFPYGNYNENVLELCKEQGYTYLFGTEKLLNPGDRPLVIERFTVNPFISAINQMYYIARNNYA